MRPVVPKSSRPSKGYVSREVGLEELAGCTWVVNGVEDSDGGGNLQGIRL